MCVVWAAKYGFDLQSEAARTSRSCRGGKIRPATAQLTSNRIEVDGEATEMNCFIDEHLCKQLELHARLGRQRGDDNRSCHIVVPRDVLFLNSTSR
jgi:hypothetical protein